MDWQNDYRKRVKEYSSEVGWTLRKVFLKVVIPLFIFSVAVSTGGYFLGWFSESATVIKEEFGLKAMLQKYEWFKDAAAQLDKKQADISVYQSRFKSMELTYGTVARGQWDRTDKEQFNLWQQEVTGVIASYNGLAAEYNSQMAKFNWAFANQGRLPEGATTVLPREYKPYQYE